MKKRNLIIVCSLLMIAGGLLLLMFGRTGDSKKTAGLLDTIDGYKGYARVVSLEEYEFYSYFVERDLPDEVSREALDQKVKEYINRVNAVFYLGNELNLCEPYSFELLKLRMEQENEQRKLTKEQEGIIYGLEQFTLETYFQYVLGNVEASIQQYLETNADEEMLKQAEEYYEKNQEVFKSRECVTYEVTISGETTRVTADAKQLGVLNKSDMGLADFLNMAEIGDIYEDIQNSEQRIVVLKEIVYNEEGFENNREIVLYKYVRNELFEFVIDRVANNNPVEFDEN